VKYVVIVVTSLIIMGLIAAMFVYQNSSPTVNSLQSQTIEKPIQQTSQNQTKKSKAAPIQPIYQNAKTGYAFQKNKLLVTFDKGEKWITVPVVKDELFSGDYHGSQQELIKNSYDLTKRRTAFLYSLNGSGAQLTYTLDQGKTWHHSVVTQDLSGLRFRKIAFLNKNFGYAILSGDRTMSQEFSDAYLTHDGGKSWHKTNRPAISKLISAGGFIDEGTGFMSFGIINPRQPELYVTQDGGKSWSKATMNMPSKYRKVFVEAEMPTKEGNHLAVLVNQGPNGDYKGGTVKGKFISKDNGLTWNFSKEVSPNETEKE